MYCGLIILIGKKLSTYTVQKNFGNALLVLNRRLLLCDVPCERALVLLPEALDLVVSLRRDHENAPLGVLVEESVAAPREAEHEIIVGVRVKIRVELPALLHDAPPLALPELQLVHQRHRKHIAAVLRAYTENRNTTVSIFCISCE